MLQEHVLKGVIIPTITPFTENGEVDEAAIEPYLDFLANHANFLSICAIYGSGLLMQPTQRKRVADIAIRTVRNRASVSVFVGALDTNTAVELAKHAEKTGARAVTCVAPIYYKQTDEAIYRYFLSLIKSVEIPVYLYDSPVYAGNQISIELLKRLADSGLGGVITGAASFGLEYIWSVLHTFRHKVFDVLSIRDGLALPAMMQGAVGFESGVANFFPELVMELYKAFCDQQYKEATILQDRMLQLRAISHGFGRNIPTLHALISMRGFKTGFPRKPFFWLNKDEIEQLRSQLFELDFEIPLK